MKEITRTKTIEEVTGYEASDGTRFENRDECRKYENTCKCVIMGAYKKLVKASRSEYGMFDTGSEEFYLEMVEIKDSNDLDVVNKALKFWYSGARLVGADMIGRTIIVYSDYDYSLTGAWTTIDDILKSIKKEYEKVIEKEYKERD